MRQRGDLPLITRAVQHKEGEERVWEGLICESPSHIESTTVGALTMRKPTVVVGWEP